MENNKYITLPTINKFTISETSEILAYIKDNVQINDDKIININGKVYNTKSKFSHINHDLYRKLYNNFLKFLTIQRKYKRINVIKFLDEYFFDCDHDLYDKNKLIKLLSLIELINNNITDGNNYIEIKDFNNFITIKLDINNKTLVYEICDIDNNMIILFNHYDTNFNLFYHLTNFILKNNLTTHGTTNQQIN